jgi:hypothetical protein
VCTEKERKRKGKRGKTKRKQSFFSFFSQKKLIPAKIRIKKYKKCPDTRVTGLGCPVTLVSEFPSKGVTTLFLPPSLPPSLPHWT